MEMAKPLPKDVEEKYLLTLNVAADLMKEGLFVEAEKHLLDAWNLFPEPKYIWDNSESALYSIATFYLRWRKYDKAELWAREIFKCNPLPGDGSPYLFLGKIYYEAGEMDNARKQLEKAYELSGRRVFQEEDPKYFKFLKEKRK